MRLFEIVGPEELASMRRSFQRTQGRRARRQVTQPSEPQRVQQQPELQPQVRDRP
jgi:hypothetical protein